MKEAKDVLRLAGMLLLGLFVLLVGVPLVLAAVGIAASFLFGLAVALIKIAIVIAVIYLILVGVRAVLK